MAADSYLVLSSPSYTIQYKMSIGGVVKGNTYAIVGLDRLCLALEGACLLEVRRWVPKGGGCVGYVGHWSIAHVDLHWRLRNLHRPLQLIPRTACEVCGCYSLCWLMWLEAQLPLVRLALLGCRAIVLTPVPNLVFIHSLEHLAVVSD